MHVYIYISIYICIYICVYIYIHMCIYMQIQHTKYTSILAGNLMASNLMATSRDFLEVPTVYIYIYELRKLCGTKRN